MNKVRLDLTSIQALQEFKTLDDEEVSWNRCSLQFYINLGLESSH